MLTALWKNLLKDPARWVYLRALIFVSLLYQLVGASHFLPFQQRRLADLSTVFDQLVGFHVMGVWFYAFYYVILLFPLFAAQSERDALRLAKRMVLGSLVAMVFFILVPATCPRPEDKLLGDGWSADFLRLIYFLDQPVNCFPSLHVYHSWLIAVHFWRARSVNGVLGITLDKALVIALVMGALGVTVSTVVIRQHFVVDVLLSFILLAAVFKLPIARRFACA